MAFVLLRLLRKKAFLKKLQVEICCVLFQKIYGLNDLASGEKMNQVFSDLC